MKQFQGKVVIITGSSAGIGRAAAVMFAQAGASIVLHGQSEQRIKESEEILRKSGGLTDDRLLVVAGSLEADDTPKRIVDRTVQKFGRIDVLVNNAASPRKHSSDDMLSLETFDYIMRVNLRSVVELTLLSAPHLFRTKGCIVNVGSVSSIKTAPEYPFYSTSKAALDHFTRNCAVMYAPHGVRVNCIAPGLTRTNILMAYGMSAEDSERHFAAMRCGHFGRPAEPEEVASVILFLADGAPAAQITGVVLPVDAGETTNALDSLLTDRPREPQPSIPQLSKY